MMVMYLFGLVIGTAWGVFLTHWFMTRGQLAEVESLEVPAWVTYNNRSVA
jgi:hypothetical protein